jgi:hypothetical protein
MWRLLVEKAEKRRSHAVNLSPGVSPATVSAAAQTASTSLA